jgi:putative phosphoesterase
MKIGIVSDTHGCAATWQKIFTEYFSDAEVILHAGDVLYHGPRNSIPGEYNPKALAAALNECRVPIVAAAGNCDAEVDSMVLDIPIQAPYAYLVYHNLRIIVNHGHKLTEEDKLKLAKRYKADIFITGHTHLPDLEKKDNTIFINPGSPGMSKAANKHGTIVMMTDNNIELIDIETGQVLKALTL